MKPKNRIQFTWGNMPISGGCSTPLNKLFLAQQCRNTPQIAVIHFLRGDLHWDGYLWRFPWEEHIGSSSRQPGWGKMQHGQNICSAHQYIFNIIAIHMCFGSHLCHSQKQVLHKHLPPPTERLGWDIWDAPYIHQIRGPYQCKGMSTSGG